MNPALLIALLQQVAVPEIQAWLKSRHDAGEPIDDAAIIDKLGMDADAGIALGEAWLTAHPATDAPSA